jgi:Na+/proline symporter
MDKQVWNTVRRWASLWTILAFVGGVALEFYGGILILDWVGVPQFSRITLAIILAFVCATFTIAGGLRGVARVNMFLDIVSFVGITILFVYILRATLSPTATSITQDPPISNQTYTIGDNLTFAFGAFFIFVPMQICALDTWQRGVAWRKRKAVAGPLIFGAALICLASYVAIAAGNYARTQGLATSPNSHPLFTMLTSLSIPSPLIGLVVAGFIAAILSTADELLNCCGYAILADFLNLPRTKTSQELSNQYIRSGKFYTGLFGFIAAGLAFGGIKMQRQISDMANVAFATQVVFILPILFAFFSKRNRQLHLSALLAMLLAFATSLIMTLIAWSKKPELQILIESAPLAAFAMGLITMSLGWLYVKAFGQEPGKVD